MNYLTTGCKPVNREESHAGHLRSSKGLKNLANKIDNSACWLSRYELRPGVGAILATICNFSRIAKNVFLQTFACVISASFLKISAQAHLSCPVQVK